jgi:hypothetical protein
MARELALEEMRDAAGEFDHLDAALHLADRVGMGLAVLGRNRFGDTVGILVKQLFETEHVAGAPQRWHVGPGRQRELGGSDRGVELGRGRQRQDRRLLAGRRVEDRRMTAACRSGELAADQIR